MLRLVKVLGFELLRRPLHSKAVLEHRAQDTDFSLHAVRREYAPHLIPYFHCYFLIGCTSSCISVVTPACSHSEIFRIPTSRIGSPMSIFRLSP